MRLGRRGGQIARVGLQALKRTFCLSFNVDKRL